MLCFTLFAFASVIYGQSSTTAQVSGTVTDSTDAVVPKAKVTLMSVETGAIRDALTDDSGEFRFVAVIPGTYDIKVEKDGFGTQSRRNVAITVGSAHEVPFRLAVGQASQVIEIQAEVPLIETERTQQANTIDQQSVQNLPINRRDYLSFSLLTPGRE